MAEEMPNRCPVPRSKDEIALELMKFISLQTGYGKGTTGAGFAGKSTHGNSTDDHTAALLELFQRCRAILHQDPADK